MRAHRGIRVNGSWLRHQLALRCMTAAAFARAAGISEATLSSVLNGRRHADPQTVEKIAAALVQQPRIVECDDLLAKG